MAGDGDETLFEHAGGREALLAVAAAHHRRCLADPELNHPFSHADLNPAHIERLAAYWGEVLGGPAAFSALGVDHAEMLRMHAGNGDMGDLGRRFLDCFVLAMDDAGLPADMAFRTAMTEYMRWAVTDVLEHDELAGVPARARVPRWGWRGLIAS